MKKEILLRTSSYPNLFSKLSHTNQYLKVFSVYALVLSLMSLAALVLQINKDPFVITLGPDGKAIERVSMPKIEDQVIEAIKSYSDKRYQWERKDIEKKLFEAEAYIQPDTIKAFRSDIANVKKFSIEKHVSQKIFLASIKIDLEQKIAYLVGDRLTSIQGVKAAGGLKLQLSFVYGQRTALNPWGVYITKEKEE